MNNFVARKVIALVVAIVAVLAVYFYTQTTIKKEIAPTQIVIVKQDIPPHTEITADMVIVQEVPGKALPQEHTYATSLNDVVGKWTVEGYGIYAKGFVNKTKVVAKADLPDSGLLELKKGEYAFSTKVDLETSHGNTIRPGSKVDLYLSTRFNIDQLSKDMIKSQGWEDKAEFMTDNIYYFGRVSVDARVLEVKDSRGRKVFTADSYTETGNSNNKKQEVARIYTLAVNLEDLQLLSKATLIGQVIPVVSGTSYQNADLNLDTDSVPSVMSDVKDTVKVIEGVTLNPSKAD